MLISAVIEDTFNMDNKVFFLILFMVAGSVHANSKKIDAKKRIHEDFITKLYPSIGEIQVNNVYNMLRFYTHSTLEQTHQVMEYIEQHTNATRSESATLRMANNSSLEVANCVLKSELNLLQAYRTTGYNLHNCIRSAQLGFEKLYVELNIKLDALKEKALAAKKHFSSIIDNCFDSDCIIKTVIQSIVRYEALREELDQEVVAGNNLNSRYLVTTIAKGCVSNSLQQIHHNFNVGKEMMTRCFHVKP